MKISHILALALASTATVSHAYSTDLSFRGGVAYLTIANNHDFQIACRVSYNYRAEQPSSGRWATDYSTSINGNFYNDPVRVAANRTNTFPLTPVVAGWNVTNISDLSVNCEAR